jgi:hypothetical protein
MHLYPDLNKELVTCRVGATDMLLVFGLSPTGNSGTYFDTTTLVTNVSGPAACWHPYSTMLQQQWHALPTARSCQLTAAPAGTVLVKHQFEPAG